MKFVPAINRVKFVQLNKPEGSSVSMFEYKHSCCKFVSCPIDDGIIVMPLFVIDSSVRSVNSATASGNCLKLLCESSSSCRYLSSVNEMK
jgi:hypothetical protein